MERVESYILRELEGGTTSISGAGQTPRISTTAANEVSTSASRLLMSSSAATFSDPTSPYTTRLTIHSV